MKHFANTRDRIMVRSFVVVIEKIHNSEAGAEISMPRTTGPHPAHQPQVNSPTTTARQAQLLLK